MKVRSSVFILNSPRALNRLAIRFSYCVQHGDILLLKGECGAGKTTFVYYLAKALGVSGSVTSPTFTLIHHYDGLIPIYHFDLYRIDTLFDMNYLDIPSFFEQKKGVVLVEWADKLGTFTPDAYLEITFLFLEKNKRKLYEEVLTQLN